jgi:hypothetical protein
MAVLGLQTQNTNDQTAAAGEGGDRVGEEEDYAALRRQTQESSVRSTMMILPVDGRPDARAASVLLRRPVCCVCPGRGLMRLEDSRGGRA